jgi:hypothetical protein
VINGIIRAQQKSVEKNTAKIRFFIPKMEKKSIAIIPEKEMKITRIIVALSKNSFNPNHPDSILILYTLKILTVIIFLPVSPVQSLAFSYIFCIVKVKEYGSSTFTVSSWKSQGFI